MIYQKYFLVYSSLSEAARTHTETLIQSNLCVDGSTPSKTINNQTVIIYDHYTHVMSESENASTIPGADKLVSYRDWVGDQSRGGRIMLIIGVFVGLVGWGWVLILMPFQRTLVTQALTWIVFLAALYTLYGVFRPSFAYVKQLF